MLPFAHFGATLQRSKIALPALPWIWYNSYTTMRFRLDLVALWKATQQEQKLYEEHS